MYRYRIEIERPRDAEITSRKRCPRLVNVILSSAIIIAVPTMFVGYWGSLLDHLVIGSLLGFITGGIVLANFAPKRMFVYNPEWCGYVTQNIFNGEMVPYGPGFHPSHWWEQRNAEGNYSLRVQKRPFEAKVITKTATVTISGEYEYAIDLDKIERAIGISQSLVERGITAFIENNLTDLYDQEEAQTVKNKIGEMGEKLSAELMDLQGSLAAIRKKYGYKTVSIVVDRIALPEDVQKTRDSLDEAETLFKIVASLYGRTVQELKTEITNGSITQGEYQKMLTRAMAVSKNETTIDVKVVEGLENNPAGAVGATVDALTDRSRRKGGGKK